MLKLLKIKVRFRPFPFLAAMLLTLSLMSLTYSLPGSWLGTLSFLLLVGLFFYSIFGTIAFHRQTSSLDLKEVSRLMADEKRQADTDFQEYTKDLSAELRFLYLWLTLVTLLACLSVAFCPAEDHSFLGVLSAAVTVDVFWIVIETVLFIEPRPKEKLSVLSREEYPNLYAAVDRAFEGISPNEPVFIVNAGGTALNAFRIRGRLYVTLGAYDYSVLTDDELTAALLYERYSLYEIPHTPFSRAKKIAFKNSSLFNIFLLPGWFLIQLPMSRLSYIYSVSELASTEIRERLAVRYVRSKGFETALVSSRAKAQMLRFFDRIDTREHILFYETEEIREDVVSAELHRFRELFPRRKTLWTSLLRTELSDPVSYHLSFPDLCQEAGCEFPEIKLESDAAGDRAVFLSHSNQLVVGKSRDLYTFDRKNSYLDPLKTLEEYDAAVAEGLRYDPIEMRPVLDACDALNLGDRLLELCEQVIRDSEISNQAAHAHYLLGNELLHRYDRSGLDHILLAMDINENYIYEGGDTILYYCRLFGMKQELSYYADRIRDITQLAVDRNLLNTDDPLLFLNLTADTSIPEKQMQDNLDYFIRVCGDALQIVWQLRKELAPNSYTTFYVVQFAPDTPSEEIESASRKIFHYLDGQPREYSFFLVDEIPFDPNKIPDACIYRK